MTGKSIMAEGHERGKIFTLWQSGSREKERKGAGTTYSFQRYSPSQ
jgi:hypothetical protein